MDKKGCVFKRKRISVDGALNLFVSVEIRLLSCREFNSFAGRYLKEFNPWAVVASSVRQGREFCCPDTELTDFLHVVQIPNKQFCCFPFSCFSPPCWRL